MLRVNRDLSHDFCLNVGYCGVMLIESGKVFCCRRHVVHLPNQVLALMQSDKGRPASGVAKFEECSCGIGKKFDGEAAFANAKVLTGGLRLVLKGFMTTLKGFLLHFGRVSERSPTAKPLLRMQKY